MNKMETFLQFLDENGIEYERFDHPPVYTVEDVKQLASNVPAPRTKNLFVCDNKKNRHFLIVVEGDKRVDMKMLGKRLGVGRIRFGSSDRLKRFLGVDPGSVTLLAVYNDKPNAVEVVIDPALFQSEVLQFHPLVNTSTLVMRREAVERFLEITGHPPRFLEIPATNA